MLAPIDGIIARDSGIRDGGQHFLSDEITAGDGWHCAIVFIPDRIHRLGRYRHRIIGQLDVFAGTHVHQ
jgi:hypothetical protein